MAVTIENIATALGVAVPAPASAQALQWAMWIDEATFLIETRRLDLGAEPIDAAKVDYVVRQAVVAQAKHPDDSTQVAVSVDDGSVSKSYRSGTGRVSISDEWWMLLGLAPKSSGAFSVTPSGSGTLHLPWCALYFNAGYCSCGVDIAGYPIFEN